MESLLLRSAIVLLMLPILIFEIAWGGLLLSPCVGVTLWAGYQTWWRLSKMEDSRAIVSRRVLFGAILIGFGIAFLTGFGLSPLFNYDSIKHKAIFSDLVLLPWPVTCPEVATLGT